MNWEDFYNSFRQPDFIPGYEIQNRLGGGAFGEVYKARKHSIGKAYAIKFLKVDDSAQRDAVGRDLEQVRHFAAIDHPNLVTIEDLGMVLDVPYLVMGYAGEETLAKRLRRGDLERHDALSFFAQACRGVLALHDRRLVHFDLKPANIFLHGDVARVGDYGLSKLMTDGRLTLSFGRGTPHYMAPEMLRGRADHRADIYSLGVILYESIAGQVPYDAESSSGLVIREEDTPPEFPEEFPADLKEVVEKALRLAPEDRYESVAELLEALGQTARRGDSIRFDHIPEADVPASVAALRPTPPAAEKGPAAEAETPPTPGARAELTQSAGELRTTAAEFARGAVEVARGVWDGLKTARNGSEPGGEGARDAEGAAGSASTPASPPIHIAPVPMASDSASSTLSPAGTIPVPPRFSGGIFGALRATVVLAVEVFVALVRGLVRLLVSGFKLARGRVDTENSSTFWKVVRLTVFFLFLALLGGFVMILFLAVLGDPLGL